MKKRQTDEKVWGNGENLTKKPTSTEQEAQETPTRTRRENRRADRPEPRLQDVRHEYDLAERVYKRALEVDPTDAATLCNYGLLLKNVRRDYDGAEFMYRRALDREPCDATTLCNYGLFLHNVRQVRAQRALSTPPCRALNPIHPLLLRPVFSAENALESSVLRLIRCTQRAGSIHSSLRSTQPAAPTARRLSSSTQRAPGARGNSLVTAWIELVATCKASSPLDAAPRATHFKLAVRIR